MHSVGVILVISDRAEEVMQCLQFVCLSVCEWVNRLFTLADICGRQKFVDGDLSIKTRRAGAC